MTYRFDWSVLWVYRWDIVNGLWMTILLFLPVAVCSLVLGTLVGVGRNSSVKLVRELSSYYVQLFRNIPAIVKLFFLYYGFNLAPFPAAVLGLTIHHSAYVAEVVQAGFESTSATLTRVALASGFTRRQAMQYVVLPIALRLVIPPMVTQLIQIVKNTAVAMIITVPELTYVISTVGETTFRGFELSTTATVLYMAVAAVIVAAMSFVEAKLRVKV